MSPFVHMDDAQQMSSAPGCLDGLGRLARWARWARWA